MLALSESPPSPTTGRVGRKRVNFDKMPARFPEGTFARIDVALGEGENRSDFLRKAVEREIEARAPPQHPTPSTGSLIDGGKKKGAEASKAASATVPAGKVGKGARRAPQALSVDVPVAGTFKPRIYQKGTKK